MYLRYRIGVTMEALAESLLSYSDKDFLVVHRTNNKGLWKDELWTLRDCDAFEIQLGPFSSQLKESHLMAVAHVVVGFPKHGRGAYLENLSLALDGAAGIPRPRRMSWTPRCTWVPSSGW